MLLNPLVWKPKVTTFPTIRKHIKNDMQYVPDSIRRLRRKVLDCIDILESDPDNWSTHQDSYNDVLLYVTRATWLKPLSAIHDHPEQWIVGVDQRVLTHVRDNTITKNSHTGKVLCTDYRIFYRPSQGYKHWLPFTNEHSAISITLPREPITTHQHIYLMQPEDTRHPVDWKNDILHISESLTDNVTLLTTTWLQSRQLSTALGLSVCQSKLYYPSSHYLTRAQASELMLYLNMDSIALTQIDHQFKDPNSRSRIKRASSARSILPAIARHQSDTISRHALLVLQEYLGHRYENIKPSTPLHRFTLLPVGGESNPFNYWFLEPEFL